MEKTTYNIEELVKKYPHYKWAGEPERPVGKKMLTKTVATLGSSEFDGKLDDIIDFLENLKVKHSNYQNLTMDISYSESYFDCTISGEIEETDEEFNKRREEYPERYALWSFHNSTKLDEQERKNRELYLELKKKYEC